MGSIARDPDELTVLVTGFCPFREQYPVNPSWEIAKGLPAYLPPRRVKDPSSRHADVQVPGVRILVHPKPIRVNYDVVRELVPSLWDEPHEGRRVDMVVHIGMAGPRLSYQIERRGHRTGYKGKDVDGQTPLEDRDETKRDKDWIWYGLPDEIETELDIPDILDRWIGHSPSHMDLRLSDDAGHYLCDFTYYSSLAHLWKQQRPRKVVFLHVPSDASQKTVAQGRDLALNLVRSVVESEVAGRGRRSRRDAQQRSESEIRSDGAGKGLEE